MAEKVNFLDQYFNETDGRKFISPQLNYSGVCKTSERYSSEVIVISLSSLKNKIAMLHEDDSIYRFELADGKIQYAIRTPELYKDLYHILEITDTIEEDQKALLISVVHIAPIENDFPAALPTINEVSIKRLIRYLNDDITINRAFHSSITVGEITYYSLKGVRQISSLIESILYVKGYPSYFAKDIPEQSDYLTYIVDSMGQLIFIDATAGGLIELIREEIDERLSALSQVTYNR